MYRYQINRGVYKVKTNASRATFMVLATIAALASTAAFIPALSGAAGKAAPAATGGVGYTAYTSVQRNAEFEAHQTGTTCAAVWSLVGQYVFTLNYGGTDYAHDINITGQTNGALSGTGGYPSPGPVYSITETVTGTTSGNDFTLSGDYGNGYVYTVNGTINATTGALNVTSWSSNQGQSGGADWTVSGAAHPVYDSGCTGKGNFHYSDADGNYYYVDVQYVKVSDNQTWFAGPVTSGNVGSGQWLFAKVKDLGSPGRTGDQIWGSFATESAAKNGVATMSNPNDGPFNITSGNLVVH